MQELTIEQNLINSNAPMPTRTYTPISHNQMITQVKNECHRQGFDIIDTKYQTNRDLSQMVAKYTLSLGDDQMGAMIGFQNSYNKTLSAKFAIGASVFICSNGMITGDHIFKKKHQGRADWELNTFISDAIGASQAKFGDAVQLRENFKQINFTDNSLHELVGKLFLEEEILRMNQLSIIQKEYRNPTHNYGVGKNNLWNIYNLATYAIEQQSHPTLYLKQHGELTKFMAETYTDAIAEYDNLV